MTPQERRAIEELAKTDPNAVVARIKPTCGRKKQVVGQREFHVDQGWVHPVSDNLRALMDGCILNEMDPSSPSVFEVRTAREALTLEERRELAEHRGRPLALPPTIGGQAPATVEELVAKLVEEKLGKAMADKLEAARAEGAAAERKRIKAARRAAPTEPAMKAAPPPAAKAAPPAPAEPAPTQ